MDVRVDAYWPHSKLGHFGLAGPKKQRHWQVLQPGEEQVSGRVDFRGYYPHQMGMKVRFSDVEGREWSIDAMTERVQKTDGPMIRIRTWWYIHRLESLARKYPPIQVEDEYRPTTGTITSWQSTSCRSKEHSMCASDVNTELRTIRDMLSADIFTDKIQRHGFEWHKACACIGHDRGYSARH
jgi:hypothetical protein